MAFCCHCLSTGSSDGAGVAACGGGSGSSSSGGSGGGSGAILFLVVVVILLLFACPFLVGIVLPLFVASCSFRRPPLARFQRTLVGCCLLRSRSRSCCGGVVAPAPSIFAPSGFSLPPLLLLLLLLAFDTAPPPPAAINPSSPPSPSSSSSSSSPRLTPSPLARRASLLRRVVRQAALVALPRRPRLWCRQCRCRRHRRLRGPAAIPTTAMTTTTNPPSSRPSRLPHRRCLYRPPP